ncbi:hypothetical protein B2J93_1848 [Marssonina coronariae]|uniref:RNA-dependent RNA polymerase n=1 Tax=Diplocarpon coronariae TaxID=2795749 RepID=A0A218ZDD5_9HELO|nr:hypothetical protein B2J93_1848 [Marssonina coronariae]
MTSGIPEPPGTPSRRIATTRTDDSTLDSSVLGTRIDLVCSEWDLGLSFDNPGSIEYKCCEVIRFCCHKKIFDRAYQEFTREATTIYQGWINKPRGERGTIPDATRRRRRPVNPAEREELLRCFLATFKHFRDAFQRLNGGTPPSIKLKADGYRRQLKQEAAIVPIPSLLSPSPRVSSDKRQREEPFADVPSTKKSKETRDPDLPPHQPPRMAPPRGRPRMQEARQPRSANTSFASTVPSVFSQEEQSSSFQNTQTTLPDTGLGQESQDALTPWQDDRYVCSSDYRSSSFDAHVRGLLEEEILNDHSSTAPVSPAEEKLSQDLLEFAIDNASRPDGEPSETDAEKRFRDQLQGTFPELPRSLSRAAPCVAYEILRVFLHADVPISLYHGDVDASWRDYGVLWRSLRDLEVLRGKPFPERSSKEAWACALKNYEKGFHAVVLAGSLVFAPDECERVFRLKLAPLKLDKSHRLGRRFGHDRFLEISIPALSGRKIPKSLACLGKRGASIVIEWLVDGTHHLIGRVWKPFMVRENDRPRKNIFARDAEKTDPTFRVYFFAVEGCTGRPALSIPQLLNCVRPTEENEWQPFLKLFNRTTLALSRNDSTLVLPPEQIRVVPNDIVFDNDPNNVMNDGAGKISPSLALKVTQKLGLSYLPAAFQGRIGEAKGLWVTDHHFRGQEDWIETYPSQRKWERVKSDDEEWHDPSHRTFEVLKCSGPLKSADLNFQFLPLLMDRARDKALMKQVLSDILKGGLSAKVEEIKTAMDDPLSLRQWVRAKNANLKDRQLGVITYKAGIPAVREERLNALLDAGFVPQGLRFLRDLTKAVVKDAGEELKARLNIEVRRSTYAYMVPDFWGVLEADEVYMDFSSFDDHVLGFSGPKIGGEVLVARSPAHFVSDIQRVKSVIKAELVGLKNVIVFSTKGNPSLAAMLSGGDFDGDIAWVCWEPSIVGNFENAEVPQTIDLVGRGLLGQDKRTYRDLVRGVRPEDQTSEFLKRSFEFNMRQSLLGIVTSFKESVCYTQKDVDTEEARILSQLASYLVDAKKQGYIFDEDCWAAVKKDVVPIKTVPIKYKTEDPVAGADHIIDHLKWEAQEALEKAMVDFYAKDSKLLGDANHTRDLQPGTQLEPEPPSWDIDLAQYYFNMAELSADPQVRRLLDDLETDISELKKTWLQKFRSRNKSNRNPNSKDEEESISDFAEFVGNLHDRFHSIQPRQETLVSRFLTASPGRNSELSPWELLKASTAVASYANFRRPRNPSKLPVSIFVWWMAGRQLMHLKAMCGENPPHLITETMYSCLKPDTSGIRRLVSNGQASSLADNASIANVDDLEAIDDD